MSYQKDIFDAIIGNDAIVAIIGTKVFPYVADHSATVPYVVYQTISTGGETAHDGSRDIETPMIQLTCWCKTQPESITLADMICNLLDSADSFGTSDITFIFTNRMGNYDEQERLFGEVIELQGISKRQ